jgi:hypothetical protein
MIFHTCYWLSNVISRTIPHNNTIIDKISEVLFLFSQSCTFSHVSGLPIVRIVRQQLNNFFCKRFENKVEARRRTKHFKERYVGREMPYLFFELKHDNGKFLTIYIILKVYYCNDHRFVGSINDYI